MVEADSAHKLRVSTKVEQLMMRRTKRRLRLLLDSKRLMLATNTDPRLFSELQVRWEADDDKAIV